jgi:hypothetical protein
MRITKHYQQFFKASSFILASVVLSACGSSSEQELNPVVDHCKQQVEGVNWVALLNSDCAKLSQYNLFADV